MFQQVVVIGNLGKDPELRTTSGGKSVATFSVAASERYKDSNGEWKEKTEWINVVVWGKQAENVQQYLSKGSQVAVIGKLQTRTYDKDGVTHYRTEVVAEQVKFLSKKGEATKKAEVAEDDIPF